MANPHLRNTLAAVPRRFYLGRAGAVATALAPWRARRAALAECIAQRGEAGLPVNLRYTLKTHTREADSQDLQRFLREGLGELSGKSRHRGLSGRRHKVVRLTAAGRALLPPPATPAGPGPRAKRRAALAGAAPDQPIAQWLAEAGVGCGRD